MKQGLMMTQNGGGDGAGRISPGRGLKMDPVKQTAGRLEFGETDLRAGRLIQLRSTEQIIRRITGRMPKSQNS